MLCPQLVARYDDLVTRSYAMLRSFTLFLTKSVVVVQSRAGMPGLDPFQLVAMLLRLTRLTVPKQGDDAQDYQQFVASGVQQL